LERHPVEGEIDMVELYIKKGEAAVANQRDRIAWRQANGLDNIDLSIWIRRLWFQEAS
jgi:hypothetical protein